MAVTGCSISAETRPNCLFDRATRLARVLHSTVAGGQSLALHCGRWPETCTVLWPVARVLPCVPPSQHGQDTLVSCCQLPNEKLKHFQADFLWVSSVPGGGQPGRPIWRGWAYRGWRGRCWRGRSPEGWRRKGRQGGGRDKRVRVGEGEAGGPDQQDQVPGQVGQVQGQAGQGALFHNDQLDFVLYQLAGHGRQWPSLYCTLLYWTCSVLDCPVFPCQLVEVEVSLSILSISGLDLEKMEFRVELYLTQV